MRLAKRAGVFLLPLLLILGCESETQVPSTEIPAQETGSPTADPEARPPQPAAQTAESARPSPADTLPALQFTRYPLPGATALLELMAELTPEQFETVLKLNRIDSTHAQKGDTLILPTPVPDRMRLSPFPDLIYSLRFQAKFILVSLRLQAWGAYEYGRLLRWGPTCSGKRSTPTHEALHYTNWKSRRRTSTDNANWILEWYFNINNSTGCSIHVYDLPGQPASHSCLRMTPDDASWVYDWAEQWVLTSDENLILRHGTPLIAFGEYDFDSPPPWTRLPEDPLAATLQAEEIQTVIDTLSTYEERQSYSRDGYLIAIWPDDDSRPFLIDDIKARFRGHPDFRFYRYHPMSARIFFLAAADHALDFAKLREPIEETGYKIEVMRISGYGRAKRVAGVASFVRARDEQTFLLESMRVPGLNYQTAV